MPKTQSRDLFAHWGRGLTLLLALAVPVLDSLDNLPVGGGHTLPITTLLMFAMAVLAVGSILKSGSPLGRWFFVPLLFMGVTLLSVVTAATRDNATIELARTWSLILFATAVAIHFAEQKLERIGVLTAAVMGGLVAALMATGQLLGIAGIHLQFPTSLGPHSTFSIFLRPTGPLRDAEALGWLMAVLVPITVAGVFTVDGKQRDLIALAFGILWAGLVASLSFSAPLAALTGLLVLLLSRTGFRNPYPGLPFLLVLVSLLMALHPMVKARWDDRSPPVQMLAETADAIDGGAADDSLQIVLTNSGDLTWCPEWTAGVHVLRVAGEEEGDLRLEADDWLSSPFGRKIPTGEAAVITLPFREEPGTGLLAVDMHGPGGFLSVKQGLTYLLTYSCVLDDDGIHRLGGLSLVRSEATIFAAMRSLHRTLAKAEEPGRWEKWRDGLSLLRGRPLTGLGPGAMKSLLGYDAGNLYLQTAVEEGAVGFLLLSGTLLVLFVVLSLRRDIEGTLYAALLLTVLVYGALDYVHDHQPVAVLSAIFLGLAWAAAFERTPAQPE